MTRDLRASIVVRMANAIEAKLFAPHELPLDDELHAKFIDTSDAALTASGLMEAVEALEPFAAFVPKMEEEFPNEPDDAIYSMVGENEIDEAVITHGDLRRARAALAKIKGE